MRKAIILTYAPVDEEEKELLRDTDVFKIACNTYCADLKPHVRLTADNIVDKCLECDTCPVVSVNYDTEKERVINACYLPHRFSSLIYCLDYLYLNGYTDVLLVANNLVTNNKPVSQSFQENNVKGVDSYKGSLYIYKYSKEGVFNVPTVKVKEFLEMKENLMPLTEEDKLLGRTEPREKTLLERTVLTDACRYEVETKGKNNKSVVNGDLINTILPVEEKKRLLNGEIEIVYNNLIIHRITKLVPSQEVKQEAREEAEMSYPEMLKYCKEHNIKPASNKKADVIEAIKRYK